MEHLLQGWGEGPHGHWTERGGGEREKEDKNPSTGISNRGEEVQQKEGRNEKSGYAQNNKNR